MAEDKVVKTLGNLFFQHEFEGETVGALVKIKSYPERGSDIPIKVIMQLVSPHHELNLIPHTIEGKNGSTPEGTKNAELHIVHQSNSFNRKASAHFKHTEGLGLLSATELLVKKGINKPISYSLSINFCGNIKDKKGDKKISDKLEVVIHVNNHVVTAELKPKEIEEGVAETVKVPPARHYKKPAYGTFTAKASQLSPGDGFKGF